MIYTLSTKQQIHSHSYKNTNMKCKSKRSTVKKYPREHFCRYSFYSCGSKRAMKPDGELHTLCEKHREEANRNQRELSKRRQEKRLLSKKLSKQLSNESFNGVDSISMQEYVPSIDTSFLSMEYSLQSLSNNNSINNFVSWNGVLNNYERLESTSTTPTSIPVPMNEQYEYDINSQDIDLVYEPYEASIEPLEMKDEEIQWLEQVLWTQPLSSTIVNI